MRPNITQVAVSTPFDDIDAAIAVLNVQEALDDSLMFNRKYFPERVRPYYIAAGYEMKVYDCGCIDGHFVIDGSGVVFG